MAISGIGNNYNNVYEGAYGTRKNEALKQTEPKDTMSVQTGNMRDDGEKAVSDYYSYLQKNYDCMSKGNVTISGEYLRKCSGDSQKAKELEDFLKRIPELEKRGYEQLSAQNRGLGGTVTYYQQTWSIGRDGSIQSTVYSVTETEMTNAERMKKNMDERLEKQKDKKEEEEKVKEQKEEKVEEKAEEKAGQEIGKEEQEIIVKYVKVESGLEAKAMMQKERLEDGYYHYPKFDINV